MRAGLLDYVEFEKETSYGTEPASLSKCLPVDAFNLEGRNEGREERPIAGTRELLRHPTGNYSLTGSVSAPFYPNEIGWLIYGLFGSVTSTQQGSTSAYKHVFSIANTLPSFTFGESKQGTNFTYLGVEVNSGTFTFNRADNEVKASFDLIGQKDKIADATFTSFTYPTADVLNLSNVTFKINDTSNDNMKSITFTFNNNMSPDDWRTLTSGRFISAPYPGAFAVSGSFSGLFDVNIIKYKWGLATATSPQTTVSTFPIEITAQGPLIEDSYYYEFHIKIPSAKILTSAVPLTTDVVAVTADFVGIYDSSAGYSVTVDLTNTTASYS